MGDTLANSENRSKDRLSPVASLPMVRPSEARTCHFLSRRRPRPRVSIRGFGLLRHPSVLRPRPPAALNQWMWMLGLHLGRQSWLTRFSYNPPTMSCFLQGFAAEREGSDFGVALFEPVGGGEL